MRDPVRARRRPAHPVDGNLERPNDSKEILLALGRHGIIPVELAERIQGMAGFRNILVHRYFKVDPVKVYQHLQQDLGDFAVFARHVRDWLAADRGD